MKDELREDELFHKYLDIVKTISKRIDTSKITIEVRMMHSERSSRPLKGTRPTNEKLYEAVAKDLAVRSRLTELKATLAVEIDLLEMTLEATNGHLRTKYVEYFDSYKNVEEKKMLGKKILLRGHELAQSLQSAQSHIDMIIKDIDQAGFSMRNMVDLFKILHERTPV